MSYRWSNRDEYEKGREDERYGHRDWDRDRWSQRPEDEAYFEGQRDERRHQEHLGRSDGNRKPTSGDAESA